MGIMDKATSLTGMLAAVFAVIGGGYATWDTIGGSFKNNDILAWSPEYFDITNNVASGEFKVIVARQKLRDDCSVEDFKLEVKDSEFIVHTATPSVAKFSGTASETVEKFGYKFTINNADTVAKGTATLLAHITYMCPEGNVVVNYPQHENLNFEVQ